MIRPAGGADGLPPPAGPVLPNSYALTGEAIKIAACARFGRWPHEFDALEPGEQMLVLAYERLARAEEARVVEVVVKAICAVRGVT